MNMNYLNLEDKLIFRFLFLVKHFANQVVKFVVNLSSKYPSLFITCNLMLIAELSLQNKNLNVFYIALVNFLSLFLYKDKSLRFKILMIFLYNYAFLYIYISKSNQFRLIENLNSDVYLFNNFHEYKILIKNYELDLINNRIKGFGTIVEGKYEGLNIYFTINAIRDLEVGSVIKTFARADFIRPEIIPGGFDESRWLAQSGTYFRLEINPRINWNVLYLEKGKYILLRWIYKLRYYISNKFVEFSGVEAGGLTTAMLYGDSIYLNKENKDLFSNLGLNHVLVASGSNVAIVLASSKSVSSKLIKKYKIKSIINVLLLSFYLLISLGDPSITRAIIMKIIEIFNKGQKRKINPVNYLCLSVIFISIYNPFSLLSLGLKLSFMACLAVYTYDHVLTLLNKSKSHRERSELKRLTENFFKVIFFYLYIQLFLLVFLWKPGYKISLIRIVSNIIFLPLFELILIWSCLFFISLCFYLPTAIIGFVLRITFENLLSMFRIFVNWEFEMNLSSGLIILLTLSVLFFVFRKIIFYKENFYKNPFLGKYIFVTSLISLLIFNCFIDFQKNGVYFVDVGQGDASVIKISGKTVLIDTGSENKFNNLELVLNYLEIRSIDYVIITHFDSDHSGGIYKLLDKYNIKNIVISLHIKEGKEVKNLVEYVLKHKYESSFNFVNAGDQYKIKDLVIYFISPGKAYEEKNKASLCFYTYLGSKTILWTGDIDFEIEKALLSKDILHPVHFLHVSHHGSKYSSSAEFIDRIEPKNAIISVGLNNRYGHPAPEVIERLKNFSSNMNIYRTDTMGTIFLPKDWDSNARELCENKYLPTNYDKIIISAKGG